MSEHRLDNFRLLYEVILLATQKDFGKTIGLNQSEVSDYNMGKRKIDDLLSREIEREYALPTRWMDRPNAGVRLTTDEYELLLRVRGRKTGTAAVLVQMLDGLKDG